MIIPEENISNVQKLKSLISKYNIDFFDFGCSHGEGLLWTQNITGTNGFGFDIDSNKLESASGKGVFCTSFDILKLQDDKLVSFTTIFHMLEHLYSVHEAELFIRKACMISIDNVFIKQPFFDADAWLFSQGLKTFYSHWSGHRNKMNTPDFYNILKRLMDQKLIKSFAIAYKKPIKNTDDEIIHSLDSPIDSMRYDKKIHPQKPVNVSINYPVFYEIMAVLDVSNKGYGKLWSILKPDYVIYDSKKDRILFPYIDNVNIERNKIIYNNIDIIEPSKDVSFLDKERAIVGYREELYSVYTSKSWRYTAPLRKIGRCVKKILKMTN